MSDIFIEKAFWFFAALILSLIAVIYRLFNGSFKKDLEINKAVIKLELITYFDNKFKDMAIKMKEDHEHLLNNVKNISTAAVDIINTLDNKYDKVEELTDKYIKDINNEERK